MGTAELCAEMQFNVSACECVQYPRGARRAHRVPGVQYPELESGGGVSPLWKLGTHWTLCRGSWCANR